MMPNDEYRAGGFIAADNDAPVTVTLRSDQWWVIHTLLAAFPLEAALMLGQMDESAAEAMAAAMESISEAVKAQNPTVVVDPDAFNGGDDA